MRVHKKLSRIFYNNDIENDLVYVDSNHPMG